MLRRAAERRETEKTCTRPSTTHADPISIDDIMTADKDAVVDEQDGQVFHIGPCALFGKVAGPLDASRLAYRLMAAIGGSDQTSLELLARITKNDTCVYNFQQVSNGEEVRGATLKVALDKGGEVTAVFCNVDGEADDDRASSRKRMPRPRQPGTPMEGSCSPSTRSSSSWPHRLRRGARPRG